MPSSPPKPCLRASLITSQGVLSSSSCLRAAGLITSRAKVRQRSLYSSCSSLSAKSMGPFWVGGVVAQLIDWSVNQSPGRLTDQPATARLYRSGLGPETPHQRRGAGSQTGGVDKDRAVTPGAARQASHAGR